MNEPATTLRRCAIALELLALAVVAAALALLYFEFAELQTWAAAGRQMILATAYVALRVIAYRIRSRSEELQREP